MSGGTTKWKKSVGEQYSNVSIPFITSAAHLEQAGDGGWKGESSKTSVVNKAPHVPHLHDLRRARIPQVVNYHD